MFPRPPVRDAACHSAWTSRRSTYERHSATLLARPLLRLQSRTPAFIGIIPVVISCLATLAPLDRCPAQASFRVPQLAIIEPGRELLTDRSQARLECVIATVSIVKPEFLTIKLVHTSYLSAFNIFILKPRTIAKPIAYHLQSLRSMIPFSFWGPV